MMMSMARDVTFGRFAFGLAFRFGCKLAPLLGRG
jgi:hypothetical protein